MRGHRKSLHHDTARLGLRDEHRVAPLLDRHFLIGGADLTGGAVGRFLHFAIHPERHAADESAGRQGDQAAGFVRFRPVLMTALAMIIGMIPMALGLGEGAEQNAPLGRAVIGGLLFATISTLFFVPVVYAGIHRYLEQRKSRAAEPHTNGNAPQEA